MTFSSSSRVSLRAMRVSRSDIFWSSFFTSKSFCLISHIWLMFEAGASLSFPLFLNLFMAFIPGGLLSCSPTTDTVDGAASSAFLLLELVVFGVGFIGVWSLHLCSNHRTFHAYSKPNFFLYSKVKILWAFCRMSKSFIPLAFSRFASA